MKLYQLTCEMRLSGSKLYTDTCFFYVVANTYNDAEVKGEDNICILKGKNKSDCKINNIEVVAEGFGKDCYINFQGINK